MQEEKEIEKQKQQEFQDLNYPPISESDKDENVESPKKMPTKFHNPFIQNIVQNVNKAFNYKPGL